MSEQPDKHSETQRNLLKETAVPYAPAAHDEGEIYPLQTPEDRGWEEFRDQCRRQMQRPMDQRVQFGFARIYRPVLDDAPWRVFATMAEYRAWCSANLPDYLGFKPARK